MDVVHKLRFYMEGNRAGLPKWAIRFFYLYKLHLGLQLLIKEVLRKYVCLEVDFYIGEQTGVASHELIISEEKM